MTSFAKSVVIEPDESVAPAVILYIFGVIAWLAAVIAWVYYFRGYA
jgi:hypothetical protein